MKKPEPLPPEALRRASELAMKIRAIEEGLTPKEAKELEALRKAGRKRELAASQARLKGIK